MSVRKVRVVYDGQVSSLFVEPQVVRVKAFSAPLANYATAASILDASTTKTSPAYLFITEC